MRRRLAVGAAVLAALVLVLSLALRESPPSRSGVGLPPSTPPEPTPERTPASRPPAVEPAPRDQAAAEAPADEVPSDEELRVLVLELEGDERMHAVCNLEPPLTLATAYLGVGDPGEFDGRRVTVVYGRAYLPILDEGRGAGVLTVEGFAPQRIEWTAVHDGEPGGCEPDPVELEPGGTVITGTVTHESTGDPAVGAWVEGCGGLGNADDEGGYYMEVLPGTCTVMAMRQDGQLRTLSEPVEVVAEPGQDQVVDLEIPGFRRAGLGVRIRQVEEGFLVEEVLEGGGAELAGLAMDDLVIQVDGVPTIEMDLAEFVERVGGIEGTEVSLVLQTGGQQREVVVERLPVD